MSGKSFWTFRLLREKEDMFSSPPEKVLYCYGIYQLFDTVEKEMPFVTFHRGLPSEDMLKHLSSSNRCNLVILDDLMDYVTASKEMESLFVKGVHHLHLTVLYINQNLYCKGKTAAPSISTHTFTC